MGIRHTQQNTKSDLKQNYIHNQNTPSTTWIIQHNLNSYPPIVFIDENGIEFRGRVVYESENRITMYLNKLKIGKAII